MAKNAIYDCPVCEQAIELPTVISPLVLSSTRVDWDVAIDADPLRAHLADHINEGGTNA